MANLPEPTRHRAPVVSPRLLRAAVSPTAIGAVVVGVLIGVLVQSLTLAIVLGAGAWAIRMLVALWSESRRRKESEPKPAALDPFSVPEPWRALVRQALGSQTRFDQAIRDWPAGPIADHLGDLRPRLYSCVAEVGALARRGAALSGGGTIAGMAGQPSLAQLGEQLRRVEAERRQAEANGSDSASDLARSEDALAAQIRAARSSESAAGRLLDRLRVVVSRLDETATSLLLIGLDGSFDPATDQLVHSLDEIHEEITALGAGLADATDASVAGRTSTTAPPLPPGGARSPGDSPPIT